ncbi:unnamed protein product [Tenebrio molitor]|nr:unnamed protein product [Tenebrio molitor]
MLALAKECKKLMIFCYVSTAFCHEDREVVYERTYEAPTNPHHIIEACEWINDKVLDSIAMKIRGVRANNYSFTKALAEALVDEQMDNLPVIIQRPSAVTPIWKDPFPGWTDNLNGPTGFLVGAGKGVIRTMHGKKDQYFDIIPVDILINGLLCTAFDFITHRSRRVYNLTSSNEIQVTFEDMCETGKEIITTELPFNSFIWCPGGSIRQMRLHHIIIFIFYQLLPALLLDPLLYILGYKPFLVRVQKKIWKGYQILEYYTSRSWLFNKENLRTAQKFLNSTEKTIFKSDLENFNLKDYFTDAIRGARRYILKDKDEDVPLALKRMRVIFYVDKLLNIMLTFGFFYYVLLILINFLHHKQIGI